jgi:hypothetical protein
VTAWHRHPVVLLLIACLLFLSGCKARRARNVDGPHGEVFHVRVAYADPGPERAAIEALGSGSPVFVTSAQVLTLADLQDVSYTTIDGQQGIAFLFTREGAAKLDDVTRAHTGRHLAIFVNNELYAAPLIRAPIPNGEAFLTSPLPQAKLQEFVRLIDGQSRRGSRWTPALQLNAVLGGP